MSECYGPQEALANVRDATLEEWLNGNWDLLCTALNSYQSRLNPDDWNDELTIEAIRRTRMQIVVGNRLSDCIHNINQPEQPATLPGLYEAEQTEPH